LGANGGALTGSQRRAVGGVGLLQVEVAGGVDNTTTMGKSVITESSTELRDSQDSLGAHRGDTDVSRSLGTAASTAAVGSVES